MAAVQDRIVLFGDSITESSISADSYGYGAAMIRAYVRRLDVQVRGFSGYNTDLAIPILEAILAEKSASNIRLLTIFFGANDAAKQPSPQHVPIDRFATNLRTMIRMTRESSSETNTILIAPAPFYPQQWTKTSGLSIDDIDRTAEISKLYSETVVRVGKEANIPTVDLCTAFHAQVKPDSDLELLLSDGLHLTQQGYRIVTEELMHTIETQLPEVYPDNIPLILPAWNGASIDSVKTALSSRRP